MKDLGGIVRVAKSKSAMHALIDELDDSGVALLLIDDSSAGLAMHGFKAISRGAASYMLSEALSMVHQR